ncbi:MAG: type VI secretion system membrane subunit TssM, partial [Pseudomonadota bacterium]
THVYLPRLILRLEEQLKGNINQPEFVLEALRAYLMLGGQAPLDENHVAGFMDLVDWQTNYPNDPELRESLFVHLASLLEILPTIDKPGLDLQLINEARRTIKQIPLAKRAYVAFLDSEDVQSLPEWQPLDHAGPQASLVLTRRSGRPLNAGIPGIFTYEAFHDVLLPNLSDIAASEAFESWLIGSSDDAAIQEIQLGALQRDILRLYYDDFIEEWERLIGDVTLQPLGDLQQSVQALKAIAGPSSPIKLLLQDALVETRLTVPPPEPEVAEEGSAGVPKAASRIGKRVATKAAKKLLGKKVGGAVKKLARLAKPGSGGGGTGGPEIEVEPPGQPVEDHFRELAVLVEGADGAPAALDQAIGALDLLQGELQTIALSPNPDQALLERGGLATVVQPVAQAAVSLPEPLSGMVSGVADKFETQGKSAARRRLNAIWQTEVLPFCRQATTGRFPFVGESQVDISLADFARLLGPGGLIDNFTNTHLTPLVDMAGPGWRWQRDVGVSDAALQPFELARRIRDGLFAGGAAPQTSFTVKPITLDSQSARAILELDQQLAEYAHGPVQPKPMQWPGPNGTNLASVTFVPVGQTSNQRSLRKEGAWSWFRLLGSGRFERTGRPDLFRVALGLQPHWIEFEITANSVANPFDLNLLSRFRCPNSL